MMLISTSMRLANEPWFIIEVGDGLVTKHLRVIGEWHTNALWIIYSTQGLGLHHFLGVL